MNALISPIALISLITLLSSACYRNPDNTSLGGSSPGIDPPGVPSPLQGRLSKLDADLKVGDTGPNVRTVHDYLTAYGYYPNADLAAEFPAWRPHIATAPQDPNVFDQETAQAVKQLQENYGLPRTGIVDAATRAAMLAARCGVPDGIPRFDPSDKFAYGPINRWQTSASIPVNLPSFTSPPNPTGAQLSDATRQATAAWAASTTLHFNVNSGLGGHFGDAGAGGAGGTNGNPTNITIRFGTVDGAGNKLAQTSSSGSSVAITLDTAETWSTNTPTPSNAVDLQSVVLHELGHAIGLGHSGGVGFMGPSAAVMFPLLAAGTQSRLLGQDDRLAVRPLYDQYVQVPGAAYDIGAGTDGSVWVIGTAPGFGSFSIHKWNGTGWDQDTTGYANRISVSADGSPWVVDSFHNVFHKSSNSPFSGTWQYVPGIAASDIAAYGATAWAVSTTAVAGGFQIYYFNGQSWDIDSNGTVGAVRIAVDSSGIPWILQSSGAVFVRYEGWSLVPSGSSSSNTIVDIAVPPGPIGAYAWGVRNVIGVQIQLSLLDQQGGASGPPGLDAPTVTQWFSTPFVSLVSMPNAATIAVAAAGPNGQPWIVDGTGKIFRSNLQ